jgi:cystathionine beta-synthase
MDLIQVVQRDPRGFTQEVRVALDAKFPRIEARQKSDALFKLLATETAVAVMDGAEFLGLVTRSDLLNRLRLQ